MTRGRGNQGLKLADRYIGIPLVAILGCTLAIMRRASNASKCERDGRLAIGILATGAIGDTILASAIMQDIRDAFPDASLTLFTSKANASVAPLITAINEAIVLPIMRPWRALAQLRRRRFDWLIDLGRCCSLMLFSARRRRQYCWLQNPVSAATTVYDHVVNHRSDRHQLENLRALVEPLKYPRPQHPAIKTEAHLPMPLPRVLLWYFTHGPAATNRTTRSGPQDIGKLLDNGCKD